MVFRIACKEDIYVEATDVPEASGKAQQNPTYGNVKRRQVNERLLLNNAGNTVN